jgi:ankyrin repeat protein
MAGQQEAMQLLLKRGAQTEAKTLPGRYVPLHSAVRAGQMNAIKLLLGARAQLTVTDHQGNTPLSYAAAVGESPLQLAARTRQTHQAQELLAAGADVNAVAVPSGSTALHAAARAGRDGIVQLLLDNGSDANATNAAGNTALFLAVFVGHAKVVKSLLAAGADVQQAPQGSNPPALHAAAAYGHVEITELLLSAGANHAAKDRAHGFTPLHDAAASGHADVACKLIAAGADVHAITNDHQTPLMLAAANGHLEVVEVLVAVGAGSQQALVDAAHKAAGKGYMDIWAFLARKVQGMYPEALSQCLAEMDAVAAARALIAGWENEAEWHEKTLEASRRERLEVEAAREQARQLIIQSAMMQKHLERSRPDMGQAGIADGAEALSDKSLV